jgi:pimeloyl-ACP methyl ester carboxylesterase
VSIPPFLALPSGTTRITLETSRGAFAVLDNRGALEGPPRGAALLVPGFTGSKEDFIALLVPLAARGVHAMAMDLAGQYESTRPDEATYSLAGFAADVWAVAQQLDGPVALVGHSFGGLVVREAVLANPLAAAGLALVASGPGALPQPQLAVLQQFLSVMEAHGLEAVWHGKRAMDAAGGAAPLEPDLDAFLTRRFLSNAPGSLRCMIETLRDVADETEVLAQVAPRTAVVIGGQDDVWPLEEQRAMARTLGAELLEIPEAGHSPAVDAPAAVAGAIALLLGDVGQICRT